jgi:hypothetical protein
MSEEFALPPPGLSDTRVVHLDPLVGPPFVDARDWSRYLTPVETRPVDFERLEPRLTEGDARRVRELALASEGVQRELEGKRYEVLWVRSRSLDRQTEYPLVIIYNYTDDVVVEAMVNLTATTVLEVSVERCQPPLVESELGQALDLVRDDGRLSEADIDTDTGMGLVVEDVNFRSPRYGHRLVDLRFGPENRRLPTAFAIVDLSGLEVVRIGFLARKESS